MKKSLHIVFLSVLILLLSACSDQTPAEESGQWDCSVACAEESSANAYVITYSDAEIISKTGTLSFQNQNDFDIVVHLLAAGEEERTAEIPAGGVELLHRVETELVYKVGCHAEVEENTNIQLMVYDGAYAEPQ